MITLKNRLRLLLQHRFGPVALVAILLCAISFFTRIVFLVSSYRSIDWSILNVLQVFVIGLLFDLAAVSYAVIPLIIFLWIFPAKWYHTKISRFLLFVYFLVVVFTLLLNAVSEWFFWEEFSVRYNFIAVDYLVYTTEVLGNIRQSYPVIPIISLIVLVSLVLCYLISNQIWASTSHAMRFKKRTGFAVVLLALPLFTYFFVNHKWRNRSNNQYVNEIAGNGFYEFGYAFWHNELDYDTFYKTLPIAKAIQIFKANVDANAVYAGKPSDFGARKIVGNGAEQKMNVVLISVESLSAEFLGCFGNQQHLTPNLDTLAAQGLLFTNLYASGTRTVRGLEALSLCIAPTPGQSIVKRPNNKNLFTLGNVFRSKGYHTRFIYGGYGYFDNMNEFFSQNGYEVTDRRALKDSEIHYSNIWGVADEDLFTLSLRKLDEDFKSGKPFFAHIMTVSNHRPYTYPSGRIDIPSHTGREGAVKYTDYAIGQFISQARLKPWFSNTLFVIVADHCASSAGKVVLPVNKYHIPMIFYAPAKVKPGKFENLTAQIDVGPTILGLLNFSYPSKFFGQNVFQLKVGQERAFISTYQSLGFIKNKKLVILEPNKKISTFIPDFSNGDAVAVPGNEQLTNEAIANYQLASYLYKSKLFGFVK